MRSTTKLVATGALALLLAPAFRLNAAVTGTSPATTSGEKTSDSSSAAGVPNTSAEPATVGDPAGWRHDGAAPSAYASSGILHPDQSGGQPRFDAAFVYSYIRAVPTDTAGNRLVWLHGGSTSINFHLNRSFGIVGDFGGYADSQVRFGTANGSPVSNSTGKAFTYLFGPRFTFASGARFSPFAQALFGGIHASAVTVSSGCNGAGCVPLPSENKFAMTAGGGLDIRLHGPVDLRLFQAEYLMTRLNDLSTGSTGTQNDVRLSGGIVFRIGGARPAAAVNTPPPAAPLEYACSVTPSSVFAGQAIAVSGTSTNSSAYHPSVYSWTSDGGAVSGTSNMATVDTVNVKPGSYTVKGHISDGEAANRNADCAATYEVRAFDPPTVACAATPSLIAPGQTATITASAASPQNRPLTYSYTTTSGAVDGTASTATLATAGTSPGTVTVNCNVADDIGHTATASTTVTLAAPEVAVKPAVTELCSIHFERNPARPARVDNEAKACLDEIAMNLQKNPDATLAIVGNAVRAERGNKTLASQRAANAKAYLVQDKGIDTARVVVYTGHQDERMASATLIPSGANFDASGDRLSH
jgi:outer membrane protein OmpA-like peptidoglycan-associated protein